MKYACPRCGCITPERRLCGECKAPRKTDHRPSSSQRGYDHRWHQTAAAYLSHHPMCEDGCGAPATDVHHLDGLGPLGPRGHDHSNLQALTHACHSRLTGAEHLNKPSGPPFLILCGRSGVGKSTTFTLVAQQLGLDALNIDRAGGDWLGVYDALDHAGQAVVECTRLPLGLRRRREQRKALVVELTASRETRRARLEARGEDRATVERYMVDDDGFGLGWEDHIEPDLTVSTERADPTANAAHIAAWARERGVGRA